MALECPNCQSPVARDGQRFCYRCGQDLRDYYESLKAGGEEPQPEPSPGQAEAPASEPPEPAPAAAQDQPLQGGTLVIDITEITAETKLNQEASNHDATLRVLLPTGDVFDRELTRAEVQLGKGPRNDIVIADPAVSTAHAVIRKQEEAYTVSDIGSRNGTFVNGERISETRKLHHGDVIGMGLSKLTFRLSGYSETGAIGMTSVLPVTRPAPPLTEDSLAAAVLAEGLASGADLKRLRDEAGGRRLYRALVEDKLVREEVLRDLMNRTFQIPLIDLKGASVDRTVAATLSAKTARDHQVFAVAADADSIILAVADPTDAAALDEARRELGKPVVVRLATQSEIFEQIDRQFGPRLIGVLPSGDQLEYFINQKEIEIGKASHNHISITDPTVSNTHAVILARDGGYSIIDLGSRNGTFVNGERLGAHARTLRHGDTIQLGQTVLTFRNRAETAENVTATLSPVALEEVRRRAQSMSDSPSRPSTLEPSPKAQVASSGSTPQADISPQPIAAAQVVAPVDATPKAIASDEDHEEKKKKKKKKGENERLKSAYISAASRIAAQVVGGLLTVVIALYIANKSMSPSEKPVELSAKGKPKIKVAGPGTGARIVGSLARYEASGAVYIPDTDRIFFVVDDFPQLFWMQINELGQTANTEARAVDIKAKVMDPEGITYDGSFFYVVGSQSQAAWGPDNALVRFLFDPNTETVGEPEVIQDLRGFLIENVPELKVVATLDEANGGINVEGIAWDDASRRLLIGFRSPTPEGRALIVPLKLTDPRKMTRETLQVGGPAIRLPLENLGIRDIQYDKRSNSFLILAGPPVSGAGGFSLWEWFASDEQASGEANPRKLTDLDSVIKPEGVARVRLGTRDFVFIVGDGGSYKKIDITETP